MTEAEVQARLAEIVTALRLIGNYSAPTYVCDVCDRKVSQDECEELEGICDDGENDCPGCLIEAGGRCERVPFSIAANLPKLEGWLRKEHKLFQSLFCGFTENGDELWRVEWGRVFYPDGSGMWIPINEYDMEILPYSACECPTARHKIEHMARAICAIAAWEKLEKEKADEKAEIQTD